LTGCDNNGGSKICTEHDWDWTENAVAATCTAPNKDTATCKNKDCTETNERTGNTAALGHQGLTAAVPATCTTAGKTASGNCTRAGCEQPQVTETVINALGHDHVSSLICKRSGCDHQYAIGDEGPAGGIIFYVDENGFTVQGYTAGSEETEYLNFSEYTAYYLEAAPENISEAQVWASNQNDLIPDLSQDRDYETDQVIGRGRMNTAIIIARGISETYTTNAASACLALTTGGKDDWFLPSKNELDALAQIIEQLGISDDNEYLWSSSQTGPGGAWLSIFWFSDYYEHHYHNTSHSFKGHDHDVRAIRAF